MVAIVERNKNSEFGSGKEQSSTFRVFFYCLHIDTRRKATGDLLPALARIASAIDVRIVVFQSMPINRRIGLVHIEVRSLNHNQLAPRREIRRSYILPALAVVLCH